MSTSYNYGFGFRGTGRRALKSAGSSNTPPKDQIGPDGEFEDHQTHQSGDDQQDWKPEDEEDYDWTADPALG